MPVDPESVRSLGFHCVLPELPFVLLQFPALEISVVLGYRVLVESASELYLLFGFLYDPDVLFSEFSKP